MIYNMAPVPFLYLQGFSLYDFSNKYIYIYREREREREIDEKTDTRQGQSMMHYAAGELTKGL
jgi:hypothetical protein